MKLLLDEMFPPAIAVELRRRGHDVVAVVEQEALRSIVDSGLLILADVQNRVIVTENVEDFRRLARERLISGQSHSGLIYTNEKYFFRGNQGTIGRLVLALDGLLRDDPDLRDLEYWL